MRKDRYSSLIMANMSARILSKEKVMVDHMTQGGFAVVDSKVNFEKEKLYHGPNWFTEKINNWG